MRFNTVNSLDAAASNDGDDGAKGVDTKLNGGRWPIKSDGNAIYNDVTYYSEEDEDEEKVYWDDLDGSYSSHLDNVS